ncbi:hypothetical protein KAT08_04450 [Candidatus Babeliales bacterium]|nr:hypothetical protein [Candidatus Babeliales bacterium]
MLFKKSKLLFLYILFLIPTNIFLKTDTTLSKIEETIDEVEKTGENTINFLKNFETKIPEIICQIQKSNNINSEFVAAFLEHYGDYLTLKEMLKLKHITKKGNLSQHLGQLILYISIESLLITCQSNIEKKRICAPLKNSTDYGKKVKKINILTKKIDEYIKKIQKYINKIRNSLSTSFTSAEEYLKVNEKIKSQKINTKENDLLNTLVEAFEYKSLLEILDATKKTIIEKFKISLKKAFKYFLNNDGIKSLEELTKDTVFKKIKNCTTKEKFLSFTSRMFDAFEKTSKSAAKLLSECKDCFSNS